MQICKYCKSSEIARCKWVNPNTDEIYSIDSGTTLEWCMTCISETKIIDDEDLFETLHNAFKPSMSDHINEAISQGISNLPPEMKNSIDL